MRALLFVVCGFLVELGWLAMWPLSGTLSHSPRFTAALLQTHPLVRQLVDVTLGVARPWLPSLADSPLTEPLGSPAYAEAAIALAAVMLWLAAMYALALFVLDRGLGARSGTVWVVLGGALLFQATLLYLPGLFSQDVFSYIAYGRLAALYDLNPYVWPPSVLRDPIVDWVADIWRAYAAPYGPVWVGLQWLVARASNGLSIADQALVYRLIANVLLLCNLGLVWRLLGQVTTLNRTQRTTALAALAWNPLIVFEGAGNAHNDVLMVSFSLLGLLLFSRSSRGVLSSAVFAVGTLVKYLSGLGLIWLALASAAHAAGWTSRGRRLLAIGTVAATVALVTSLPWLELPDSLDPLLSETTAVGYVNSMPDHLVLMVVHRVGVPLELARVMERLLPLSFFAGYLVWEARRVVREPNRSAVARALARSCLVYTLLVTTSFQTWYLCLPVSIAVVLGWRHPLAQVTLAYSALALPALYLSYYLRESTPAWVFLVYALGPLVLLLPRLAVHRPMARPQTADQAEHPRRLEGVQRAGDDRDLTLRV